MSTEINKAIYKLIKRAEKYEKEHLVKTFVDVGPLFTLLQNPDHQIIYGRRGTGKTHALGYLESTLVSSGHLAINIDMRIIGSNGGVYSDYSLTVTERATRLLIDVFSLIHDRILDHVIVNDEKCDLSQFGPLLEQLSTSISEIEVIGNIEQEDSVSSTSSGKDEFGVSLSTKDFSISSKTDKQKNSGVSQRRKIVGNQRHRVHFTTVSSVMAAIRKLLNKTEIWILLDEWAETPLDLQPYLADLLRRTLFPIKGLTVKIAAIEKRAHFKIETSSTYIGIENGADVSASLNLDEFMVFDNDSERAIDFFKTLIYNHVNQFLTEAGIPYNNKESFVNAAFTQIGAFEELVRASEGIPRDAINILTQAAIKANSEKISIPLIRIAARSWFSTDKEKSVMANKNAKTLLHYIIDQVIGSRNSRAFLLSSEIEDENIEYLFDNRVIHLIKQNISSKDSPGVRFNVFSIDFGAYAHLINTNNEPKGLFLVETENGEEFINVPMNDYRSIRRSVLKIDDFYSMQTIDTNP